MRLSKIKLEGLRGWVGVGIAFSSLAWSMLTFLVERGFFQADAKTSGPLGRDMAGIIRFRDATTDLPFWMVVGVWAVEAAATVTVVWLCDWMLRDGRFSWKLKERLRVVAGAITSTHLFVFHLWFFWPRLTQAGIAASVFASGVVVVLLWRLRKR